MSLVERDGKTQLPCRNVTSKNLREVIVKTADRKSYMMTDGRGLSVNRQRVAATVASITPQAVRQNGRLPSHQHGREPFRLLKRGVYGTFHNISERAPAPLPRRPIKANTATCQMRSGRCCYSPARKASGSCIDSLTEPA